MERTENCCSLCDEDVKMLSTNLFVPTAFSIGEKADGKKPSSRRQSSGNKADRQDTQ